jgi:uncharacterized protein
LGIWQNKKGYPRMSTVILELDQDVIAILEQQHQPVGEAAREMIVFELYRRGSLSSGKASQLLSLTRYEFIRRASELRIPYFRFTEQELKDEIHQSESLWLLAVSNSSPLIALEKIGKLDLLRGLFSAVIIPPAVASEIAPSVKLPPWIAVDQSGWSLDPRTIRPSLGPGESQAISLSLARRPGRIILDDEPARRLALSLGLPVIGTLGIILAAKRRGLLLSIRSEMDSLLATGFFIGAELFNELLQLAGESSQTD